MKISFFGTTMTEQFSKHLILNNSITEPFPEACEIAYFAMGCFWGAERLFWQQTGVYSTSVGYSGGHTDQPSYQDVCSGQTGHTETVQVVYHPDKITFQDLLNLFWESHNPTQGMRQGNDVGSQYRSAIFYNDSDQQKLAMLSQNQYQSFLKEGQFSDITTEISKLDIYWIAENEHQQYLAKNPSGYCGLKGTGISCSL